MTLIPSVPQTSSSLCSQEGHEEENEDVNVHFGMIFSIEAAEKLMCRREEGTKLHRHA